ncbi:MAG: peptidoglycan-binding protein, partial [Oscillospiraceae bacterium]
VMAFQRQFGLTADGIIGQQTWNRIVQVYNDLRSRLASPQAQPPVLSENDLPTAAISEEKAELPSGRTADAGRQMRQLRQQMRDLLKEHPELSADRRAWHDDPVMEAGLFDSGAPRPKQS